MEDLNSMSKSELIEYIKMLEDDNKTLSNKINEDAEAYSALEKEYENIIEEKDKELLQLKGKVISQDITLASYKDKIGIPIIVEGEEHDLYKAEQKDLIIGLIKEAIDRYPKFTRSYKILESILDANKESRTRDNIKEAIGVLKGYGGMTKDIISRLAEVGITVDYDDSRHYKLYLKDDKRFIVTLSHSPSDGKCGINCISDINRILL